MMHGNAQIAIIELPQILKHKFGLRAGIDENNAHPRIGNGCIKRFQRMAGHMARPGDTIICLQDINLRRRCLRHAHNHAITAAQPVTRLIRLVDGGGQADPHRIRGKQCQPCKTKAEKITAFIVKEGVQFIDDDIFQPGEIGRCILIGKQQSQRFWGSHQKVWRFGFLPLAARRRCVASPCLKDDRQV